MITSLRRYSQRGCKLLRKTDSNNPADWVFIAESDLIGIRHLISQRLSYPPCASKLAKVLEKLLKAELLRTGWFLEKTHALLKLGGELRVRDSKLSETVRPLCEDLAEKYFTDRYPGFDLESPDWNTIHAQSEQIASLLVEVKRRIQVA